MRFNLFRYFIIIFCLIIISRLFQIQVLNASRYKSLAREQQWQEYQLYARRGNIYTADGYPVASSQVRYEIILNLKEIGTEIDIYKALSPYIENLDRKTISDAQLNNRTWLTLKNPISYETKKTLETIDVEKLKKGLSFKELYTRYYPEQNMLSHVLGFVGKDEKINESLFDNDYEKNLYNFLQDYEPKIKAEIMAKNYSGSLKMLAAMRAPISSFFDNVMVKVDNQIVANNRLLLLSKAKQIFDQIAKFDQL